MPYEKKGKCVYKKPTGEKVGCSDTVAKAKKYIQALYASELNESLPNTISPEEQTKIKEFMKAFMEDKQTWIDKYGLEQANFVMYKTAVKKAKEEMEKTKETMDESKMNLLKELIKDSLKNPKKADLNKDGKLSSYEKKRGAAIEKAMQKEDLDLGHQDDEPNMIKGDLYRIGKYAMELYKMVDKLDKIDGEVDFPHWWQAKIIKAKSMLVSAKHYLDFELKEPQINAMVDIASEEDIIDEDIVKGSNIKKVDNKWRVISGKTGKMWPQTYDTKKDAENAIKAYHASK